MPAAASISNSRQYIKNQLKKNKAERYADCNGLTLMRFENGIDLHKFNLVEG